MLITFVTSWDMHCGIATYTANFASNLPDQFQYNVFKISKDLWQHTSKNDIEKIFEEFSVMIEKSDVVHFQHEHGIWGADVSEFFGMKIFIKFLLIAVDKKKKCLVTFHTNFWDGNKKYIFKYVKRKYYHSKLSKIINDNKIMTFVHNKLSKKQFRKIGVKDNQILNFDHPCIIRDIEKNETRNISTKFDYENNAIIIAIFGFVNFYKGHDILIDVINDLPSRYKLLIIGGQHPEDRGNFFDGLLEKIKLKSLDDRIEITGWVEEEIALKYLHKADICVAPYREVGLSGSGALTWLLSSNKWIITSKIEAFMPILRKIPNLPTINPEKVGELILCIKNLAEKNFHESKAKIEINHYITKHNWKDYAAMISNEFYS